MRIKLNPRTVFSLFLAAAAVLCATCRGKAVTAPGSRGLKEGWHIQTVAAVDADAADVSQPGFDTTDWLPVRVPSTILAAQVAGGAYPNLYFGNNLDKVSEEQYQAPWWYRTEVDLSAAEAASTARLVLDGVNYSAEVWLNGRRLASREVVVGAFRVHELEVTGRLRAGANALAIQVHPPEPGDFSIGFVDWNPRPPDRNMGLWRPVTLALTGDVSLRDVFVTTEVDTEFFAAARITVSALLRNHGEEEVKATVAGTIEQISFAADVVLAGGEEKVVAFAPEQYPGLVVDSPRLWWPHTMGEPELYRLRLEAVVRGRPSDVHETTFGIREVATYFNDQGHRGFTVNGVPILIRGGGWVDDLLLADTEDRQEAQIAYVKHMGLNTVRLEGFWGSSQTLYDIADREGILIMPGWSCQWEWADYLGGPVDERYGGVLEVEDMELVTRSLRDQVRWLRNHPSIFTWVLASDLLPHPDLERRYNAMLQEEDTTRPPLVSCGWLTSEVSGPSGVKMRGPYDWVPPAYWYEDREHGGAYGFNTETGPGPQPPPIESVKKMIPPEHLWPIDEMWEFHCGRNEFNTMARYTEALDKRYGPSGSVEEFLRKAQAANYEAIRPMFEAFAVNRPQTTGVIQWMLNSAWPEMYWQLYDHYLMPNGAFYGARAACRPTTLAYNYHDRGVYVVNDTRVAVGGAVATIRAFDLSSRETLHENMNVSAGPGASRLVLSLAELRPSTPVWFLDLRLADGTGRELSRNFYWLPRSTDVLDPENSLWFVTPVKHHADLTALQRLPQAELQVEADLQDGGRQVSVRLANPSDSLAFFLELRVVDSGGNTILPVLWDDNNVSIVPGEDRRLVARFPQLGDATPARLEVSGWNVAAVAVALSGEAGSSEGSR